MEKLDEKKKIRAEAGRKGGIASALLKQKDSNTKAVKKSKESKEKESKEKESKENNINKRMKEFEKHLQSFIKDYDSETLEEFFNYWTEPNKSNTKMKFEIQPTWDTKRRLQRWVGNDYSHKKNGTDKQHNFKMPDGKNYLAWCSKCLKSDFYESYNFDPSKIESKCCNDYIIDETEKNKRKINA